MSSRLTALLLALVAVFAVAPQHAHAAASSCRTVCADPGIQGIGPRVRAHAA
jgi:hypothetical protein